MKETYRIRADQRGFTLLEVLVALSITALIGALALVSVTNSRRVRDLAAAGQNTLSLLRTAQTNTISGKDGSQWGVHVEGSEVILFRGSAYAGADIITSYPVPDGIEIVDIDFGGGQDAIFRRVDGTANQSGAFTIRVEGSSSQMFPVSVDSAGNAYRTGSSPVLAGTRIVDARHRAFDLGWSIRGYAILTLNFNDGEKIEAVSMGSYFNSDQTEFDWSDTITVGGADQTVRVHTTSLTSTDTVLSIDRDCRTNTKKVRVTIGSRDIATFEADCETVTVEVFGGEMSEP